MDEQSLSAFHVLLFLFFGPILSSNFSNFRQFENDIFSVSDTGILGKRMFTLIIITLMLQGK